MGDLQNVIDNKKFITTQKYSLNICIQTFNRYLKQKKYRGLILFDALKCDVKKFEYVERHCLEEFTRSSRPYVVHPIIQVNSKYSQLHQIADIVLGSIQWSLRENTENFLPNYKDRFWNNGGVINNYGINIYPKRATTVGVATDLRIISDKFIRLL